MGIFPEAEKLDGSLGEAKGLSFPDMLVHEGAVPGDPAAQLGNLLPGPGDHPKSEGDVLDRSEPPENRHHRGARWSFKFPPDGLPMRAGVGESFQVETGGDDSNLG